MRSLQGCSLTGGNGSLSVLQVGPPIGATVLIISSQGRLHGGLLPRRHQGLRPAVRRLATAACLTLEKPSETFSLPHLFFDPGRWDYKTHRLCSGWLWCWAALIVFQVCDAIVIYSGCVGIMEISPVGCVSGAEVQCRIRSAALCGK